MRCIDVRPLLPEHALGTLDPDDHRVVTEHLAWCAGCRKEAGELAEGAALVGHALPPAHPPEGLQGRVVREVMAAAGRARRPRGAMVAALVAAALAAGAFGWAVAMTGRAEHLEAAASTAAQRTREFEGVIAEFLADADKGRVYSTDLDPVGEAHGGGRAVVFDSPGGYDWALIVAGGMAEGGGPFRAYLDGGGHRKVGTLHPSSPGELAAYRYFDRDLSKARGVVVRDRDGRALLRGTLSAG
jgi:putative zinc finger protein